MNVLDAIRRHARETPDAVAFCSAAGMLTYGQLDEYSDRLAGYLQKTLGGDKSPLVVYGHKHPYMLVCFLACVKSGRAYCPEDISVPYERVVSIVREAAPPLILATEPVEMEGRTVLGLDEIRRRAAENDRIGPSFSVEGGDVFYIIFTSGSTGTPKGVQITADCLGHFVDWSSGLVAQGGKDGPRTFLNQAPFSFDLSVMDTYTCLCLGGRLWALEKDVQDDMKRLFASLKASDTNVWVSTPSFADMCLVDRAFGREILPRVERFLFCGETLSNSTVRKLHTNFPGAAVVNTYGPTESTVAVTGVEVTPELNAARSPLPVGSPKKGTFVQIMDREGCLLSEGERGEIILVGDTVSVGYFRRPDLSRKVFFRQTVGGIGYRAYHTGDEGYIRDGQLYYCGRIDLQIKLHGFRIEVEDVENNILKLDSIKKAVVVPVEKDGAVKSLTAFVIPAEKVENAFEKSQEIRRELARFVPDYMIPKKFIFVDAVPMTNNGKADRKALRAALTK